MLCICFLNGLKDTVFMQTNTTIFKILKKADFLLLGALLLFAFAGSILLARAQKAPGETVRVTVDGEVYGEYPLSQDAEIFLPPTNDSSADGFHGENVIVIAGGEVRMREADCKNQVCVRTGSISRPGQTIVCLPHRVVVTILKGEEVLDAVTH